MQGLDELERYLEAAQLLTWGEAVLEGAHPDKHRMVLEGGVQVMAKPARLVCSTRVVSGVVTFTIGSHAIAASLARAHMVYASGVGVAMGAGRWQLLLQDRRTLRRGSYTLTLRSPQHGRWVTNRRSITIT